MPKIVREARPALSLFFLPSLAETIARARPAASVLDHGQEPGVDRRTSGLTGLSRMEHQLFDHLEL